MGIKKKQSNKRISHGINDKQIYVNTEDEGIIMIRPDTLHYFPPQPISWRRLKRQPPFIH